MLIDTMSLALFAWVASVILVAGLTQGILGFGFPFIATPLIAMMSDMRFAIVAVLLPTITTILVTLFTSGPLGHTVARFWTIPLYAIVGSVVGTWLFVSLPNAPYSLVLALLTLAYLGLQRLRKTDWPLVRRNEQYFAPLAGVTAGVFEGTVNVSAPVLIVFYLALKLTPSRMVQAMCMCFLVAKATQLTVLTVHGGVRVAEWLATFPLVLIGAASTIAGVQLRHRVDASTYRLWVTRALFIIAIALLARYGSSQFD